MYAFLLQDWVTIRSASGGAITQGEASWLDLSEFLDVVVFLETKNFAVSSGVLYMAYQTAPTKDEVLFQPMIDISTSTSTPAIAVGVQTTVLLRDVALCPLARWFRWQLTPPTNAVGITSFEATFRIWLSANQPGGFAQSSRMSSHMGYGDSAGFGGPAWTQGPAVTTPAPSGKPKGPVFTQGPSQSSPTKGSPFAQGPAKGSKDAPGPGPSNDVPPGGLQLPRNRVPLPRSIVKFIPPGTKGSRR